MRDDLNRADLMSNRTLHEGPRRDRDDAVMIDEADVPSGSPLQTLEQGLKVWLDVGLKLGNDLEKQRSKADARATRLQRNTPVDYTTSATGVFTSPGPLILNLGTPDVGTFWEVESVMVGSTEVNVSVAGVAGLYVTAVPQSIGLGLVNAVDIAQSGTLPNAGFYGRRDVIVTSQEYLVVAIFSGTVSTVYTASCSVTVLNVAGAQGIETVSI